VASDSFGFVVAICMLHFYFPKMIFHLEFGLSVSLIRFCGQESSDFVVVMKAVLCAV